MVAQMAADSCKGVTGDALAKSNAGQVDVLHIFCSSDDARAVGGVIPPVLEPKPKL